MAEGQNVWKAEQGSTHGRTCRVKEVANGILMTTKAVFDLKRKQKLLCILSQVTYGANMTVVCITNVIVIPFVKW